MNYVIASAIVEKLTNTSFYDIVQEYLWDPLGVEGATWNAKEASSSDGGRSFGWLPTSGGQEVFEFWTEGEGEELAAAGSALMRGVDMVNPSIPPLADITTEQQPDSLAAMG
jgi:CubicO group peptidase (beta-lactamase class C family)